jgi:hypothetical protein
MIRQQAVLPRGGKNVVREHAAPTRLPLDGGRGAPRGGDNPFMGRTFGLTNVASVPDLTQRAVRRFGDKAVASKKRIRVPAPKTGPTVGAERAAQGGQQAQGISLGDATLRAVRAHANGASTDALLKHLSRRFGMTVRPNHLGGALHRHQRAGRLENRDQRWYLPR